MTRNATADGACATVRYCIEVEVDYAVPETGSVDGQVVVDAITCILAREQVPGPAGVNVMLTGDDVLRRLNRRFANDDHATDVLAFPAADDDGGAFHDWPSAEDAEAGAHFLGDIAVSVPQVSRQAREHGVATERELAMLAIHGTLHLLGYDHASPDEERVMFGKTDAALAQLFAEVPDSA